MSNKLVQCVKALEMDGNVSASDILGDQDALKLRAPINLSHPATRRERGPISHQCWIRAMPVNTVVTEKEK